MQKSIQKEIWKKKEIILFLFFLFLLPFVNSANCDSELTVSCTCASYPCSAPECTDFCLGSSCGNYCHYDLTGSCVGDLLSGGECVISSYSECDYDCSDGGGCIGDCCIDGDCSDDYNYCVGSSVYERDYSCSGFYFCSFSNNFVTNCDSLDGEYVCVTGNSIYSNNYGCSGGSCYIESATFIQDCSFLDSGWTDYSCISSSHARRSRTTGSCEQSPVSCFAITEYDTVTCDYGCSQFLFEEEFQYNCESVQGYVLQSRDTADTCRRSEINNNTWINEETLYCDEFCDSNYDNIIYGSENQLPSPCKTFQPEVVTNPTIAKVFPNESLTMRGISDQQYKPDLTCYDETNDGIYEACYGTGYSGVWNQTHTLDTENTGIFTAKVYFENTVYGWDYTIYESYQVLTDFIDAEITVVNYDDYSPVIGSTVLYDSVASISQKPIIAKCWGYSGTELECYGNLSVCSNKCPGYTHVSNTIDTQYSITKNNFFDGITSLTVYSDTLSDSDFVKSCFWDNVTNQYCFNCFDGLKNDDETGIDIGGHCGNCFNGILDSDAGETLIDYGGPCGTCYDGIRQSFETIDVDYGGEYCGSCTGVKETDEYWQLGHRVNKDVPFDDDYCGSKTDAIFGTIVVIALILMGGVVIILLITFIIFIASIFTTGAGLISVFTKRLFDKNNKEED